MGEPTNPAPELHQDKHPAEPLDWEALFAARAPLLVDIIAWFIWIFALVKLFILDVDDIFLRLFLPSHQWLLHFKIIFFVGLFAFLVIAGRRLHWWRWVAYVLFFPLIVIFWKLPIGAFRRRSLNTILIFVYSVFGIVRSIKLLSVAAFLLMICATLCAYSTSTYVLWASASVLIAVLGAVFLTRLVSIVTVSAFFEQARVAIDSAQMEAVGKINADAAFSELALVPEDDQGKALVSSLDKAVLTNRILLFVAKQLRSFQTSGIIAVSSVMATLFLISLTVFVFAFVNMAAYNADASNFIVSGQPTAFSFFALSFKTLILSGIDEIRPKSELAQSISMLENVSSIFVLTIFASIIVSSRSEKQKEQLDQTIRAAESNGRIIEEALKQRYKIVSIDAVLGELRRIRSSSISVITYLTTHIND